MISTKIQQPLGMSWNFHRAGLLDIGKSWNPNPVEFLFGASKIVKTSDLQVWFTISLPFYTIFGYCRAMVGGHFPTSTNSLEILEPSIRSSHGLRHDLPRCHGGRPGRHGFAEAEPGADAERRTQLRRNGTEVLQRLGAGAGAERMAGRFYSDLMGSL